MVEMSKLEIMEHYILYHQSNTIFFIYFSGIPAMHLLCQKCVLDSKQLERMLDVYVHTYTEKRSCVPLVVNAILS